MTQRIIEGNSPFRPDNNHLHHKLMRLGLFHTEAVFIMYLLQSVLIISALFVCFAEDWLLLLGYIFFALMILYPLTIAEQQGYKINRYWLDRRFKARLRLIKKRGMMIRFLFTALQLGLFSILLFSALLPAQIPSVLSIMAGLSIAVLALSLVFQKISGEFAVRLTVYCSVPYLIYLSTVTGTVNWTAIELPVIYDLSFLFLACFAVVVQRFTRRKRGFKFTTLDFLILVIVFVLLVIPDAQAKYHHLGLLASKVIIFFFSFEVLVGELRGKMTALTLAALLIFLVVILRGWFY